MKTLNRPFFLVVTAAALLVPAAHSAAQPTNTAHTACLFAVGEKHGGEASELKIVSSKPSPGGVDVLIEADGKRWRCLATNQGKVTKLTEVAEAPQAEADAQ